MPTRQKTDATIRYYVQRVGEPDVVVELSAKWKVTFGYVNPAKSEAGFRGGEGHCLRAYEGEKLRLVMGNVLGFRDLSIPLAKKFEKESGAATWESDSEGNFTKGEVREIESGYVVEDDEDPFDEPGEVKDYGRVGP